MIDWMTRKEGCNKMLYGYERRCGERTMRYLGEVWKERQRKENNRVDVVS